MSLRKFTVLALLLLLSALSLADSLGDEKARAKQILKIVSKDIEKNYYDPSLKGLNWAELNAQAVAMIDNANSLGQIYTTIFGLVDRLNDSHTMFFSPGHVSVPQFGFEAKAYGNEIYVTKLKKKGQAEAAGLQLGDRIVLVNGFDAERQSFDKMMLFFHALQPVSQLDLVIMRGKSAPQKLTIAAKVISSTMVYDLNNDLNIWDLIVNSEDESKEEKFYFKKAEENDGIGYLAVRSFMLEPESIGSFATLAGKAKAVIVDLRGNFGGREDALASFTNHFISEPDNMADVVTRKGLEPRKIKPSRGAYSVPMAILVDSQTSSAAEMFARYFQLKHKAIIIGDQTAGRVVSSKFFLEQLGTDRVVPFGVQISVGKILFPNNEDLEGKGVTPDQKCLPTAEDLHGENDVCYSAAMALLRKQLVGTEPVKAASN